MNAAAHIGVQNEWLLYVVLQPNFYYLLQTRPTYKFTLMTIFPPTTTSHDRWIGNNKQLKCSVPVPRNVQLSSRRLYTRNHSLSDSLIHSVSQSVSQAVIALIWHNNFIQLTAGFVRSAQSGIATRPSTHHVNDLQRVLEHPRMGAKM